MTSLALMASQCETPPAIPTSAIKLWMINLLLQISQRLGAVALLAMLGVWALLYLDKNVSIALAVVAGAANCGLCSALIAKILTTPGSSDRREANGVAIFNLVLLVLAIHLMIYTRLDVIRSAAHEFFTPTPAARDVSTIR